LNQWALAKLGKLDARGGVVPVIIRLNFECGFGIKSFPVNDSFYRSVFQLLGMSQSFWMRRVSLFYSRHILVCGHSTPG
jgi:hypothetical protein